MIEEHITTIDKSMKQVVELSSANPVNYNQLVRWVTNKDVHAQQIQDIVHAYFLTQRVKPADRGDAEAYKKYSYKVVLLHQLLFYAMKTKQTTDLSNVEKLRQLLAEFHNVYFEKKAKEHLKKEHH
jgi:nickel superoxide dismutase